MRLVCPNCSAQYEIDIALVPEDGRDVQCSNCGHTWFEMPPEAASNEDEALETVAIDDDIETDDEADSEGAPAEEEPSDVEEAPSQAAKAIAAASEEVASSDDPFEGKEDPFEDADDDIGAAAAISAGAGTIKARRPADAADLDILREEAERELSQRRAPPSESLEAQTDLGLDTIQQRGTPSRALRARLARSEGNAEPGNNKTRMIDFEEGTDDDYKAPQRDLLPDIDEINSTLKPGSKRNDPTVQAAQRQGFRLGFGVMMVAAIALICAYAYAPAIAKTFPTFEPGLISYVDAANQLRDWIDELISGIA